MRKIFTALIITSAFLNLGTIYASSKCTKVTRKLDRKPVESKTAGIFIIQSFSNNRVIAINTKTQEVIELQHGHQELSHVGKILVSHDQTVVAVGVYDDGGTGESDHGLTTHGFGVQLYSIRGDSIKRIKLRVIENPGNSHFYEESVTGVFTLSPRDSKLQLLAVSVQTGGYSFGKNGGRIEGSRIVFFRMNGQRYWTYNEPSGRRIDKMRFSKNGKILTIPKLDRFGNVSGERKIDITKKKAIGK